MTPIRESTARTRELGAELRRLREAARFTGTELARKLGWHPSKVSRLESGDSNSTEVEVAVFSAYCGAAGDELTRILDLTHNHDDNHWLHIRDESFPEELRSVIVLEATAQILTYYESMVIPGLVQTEDYARSLFHERGLLPREIIESRVRTRMDRQRVLHRRNQPAFTFLVHENALRTPVGDDRIMHEQMLHLLLLCATPPYQVRVLPTSVGARAGTCGPFTWTAHRKYNPVIYVEQLTTGLFLEGHDDRRAYQSELDRLLDKALNEVQSREFLASLASEYERKAGNREPGGARSAPGLAGQR